MAEKVVITPKDTIDAAGKTYNLYHSLVDAGTVRYTKVRSGGRVSIVVDKYVMAAVRAYAQNDGFAGLSLVAYLRKVFSTPRQPDQISGADDVER